MQIVIEAPKYRMLILAAISFIASWMVFWPVIRIAIQKNIVDNPEARKLQKTPIPVMGGVVIFFGIVVGMMFFKTMIAQTTLLPVLGAMVMMLYVGTMDDVIDIKPWKRMALEVLVALLLTYGNRMCISNFQGLWGIETLPLGWAIPLTVLMFVGVINAINMIDGIDGLLSGFGVLICTCLGLLCFLAHDYSNAALASVTCGALIPFFLHNVFGRKSKMFLGDGGSMLLGTIIASFVIAILSGKFHLFEYQEWQGMSLIAIVLAVVAIPVADTLRVMTVRICHKVSPFHPDNNHLHHRLLRIGLPHFAITCVELFLGLLVIGTAVAAWLLGAGMDVQLYCVIIAAAICDGGLAWLLLAGETKQRKWYTRIRTSLTGRERKGKEWLNKIVDGKIEL